MPEESFKMSSNVVENSLAHEIKKPGAAEAKRIFRKIMAQKEKECKFCNLSSLLVYFTLHDTIEKQ
ncbi:hypothetical protein V6R97_15000 [Chromohalobacter salexigens]|uniref:hypothetical protein n=1 Tax=Chromohalobacter israelensis TaxID=141390 RepID=UPI0032E8808D